MSDPRVYFAAERTLLAWIRSGLTIVALGFVVSRFGLFVELISQRGSPGGSEILSRILGVGLVILGSVLILASLYNHRVFVRSLPAENVPSLPLPGLSSCLALALSVAGLLLALYLTVA